MSPRVIGILGVLLLAAGLCVRAALAPSASPEPATSLPPPRAAPPHLEGRRIALPDGPPAPQDVVGGERKASPGHVLVLVRRPDGKPVPGATVTANLVASSGARDARGVGPEPATTDAAGRAEIAVPEFHGTFVASKGTEVGLGISRVFADEGDPLPITITLLPASVAVVEVVDAAGRGVRDAAVWAVVGWRAYQRFGDVGFRTRDGGIVPSSPFVAWSTRTDASGVARFPSLPPLDFESADVVERRSSERIVVVEVEGFRSTNAALADGPNRIVLTPAVEYRARVVDEDGRALREASWRSGGDLRGWGDDDGRVVALVPDADPGAEPPPLVLDADGYLPRAFERTARAPAVVDLGTVALHAAVLLRGTVRHADGRPAGGVLVTADHESADRVFVQGLTAPDGAFGLEPPSDGAYRVSVGAPGLPQRGSTRDSLWEASAAHVRPGEECRLVLHFVPGLLIRFVPPDPKPQHFSLDNVSIVPRSADGLGQGDWLPEDDGRYLVRLFGRGPWTVEIRHPQLEPVDLEVEGPAPGPDEFVLTRDVALRAAAR